MIHKSERCIGCVGHLFIYFGKIVFDTAGEERAKLSVADLLEKFKVGAGEELDNDRVLLS